MPTYFARQPNGRFAVFSTVTDSFHAVDLTEADVRVWCGEHGIGLADAAAKLDRAKSDTDPGDGPTGDGLGRWRDALATLMLVHGTKALAEFLNAYPETYAG